ncbi:hypothetical protein PCASD_15453 [Puccinia coronata f. sp. avenae]|uniref:Uncharacterized protein n=1 Tax=Puccinia coronata f. sp. avenae TaxID=200324 RepID=A0A2N5UPJ6_9BASI|nr:hypothetical protein PCASD_15453 [Puccinia coronata f. sp. avenae]
MQRLQEIFCLDNYHRRKALEILKMPTGALSVLVFGALAIDRIHEIAKQAFLQPNVDCYVRGRYKLGMGDRSLLYLTMNGVEGLSDDFKRDHLPLGFLKHNPVAQSMVLGVVRDITKHPRGNICDAILYNVLEDHGNCMDTGSVPPIAELSVLIYQQLTSTEATMKDKDVEEKISHLLQGRLAHIRIQTIHQLLKSLGADYQAAHTKAVLQKDHALFGQGDSFLQIDQHAITMPTEAEVQALINPNQSTSAS